MVLREERCDWGIFIFAGFYLILLLLFLQFVFARLFSVLFKNRERWSANAAGKAGGKPHSSLRIYLHAKSGMSLKQIPDHTEQNA